MCGGALGESTEAETSVTNDSWTLQDTRRHKPHSISRIIVIKREFCFKVRYGVLRLRVIPRSCHRWADGPLPSAERCLWWWKPGCWGRWREVGSSAAPHELQTAGLCSWWFLHLQTSNSLSWIQKAESNEEKQPNKAESVKFNGRTRFEKDILVVISLMPPLPDTLT